MIRTLLFVVGVLLLVPSMAQATWQRGIGANDPVCAELSPKSANCYWVYVATDSGTTDVLQVNPSCDSWNMELYEATGADLVHPQYCDHGGFTTPLCVRVESFLETGPTFEQIILDGNVLGRRSVVGVPHKSLRADLSTISVGGHVKVSCNGGAP